VPFSSLPTRNLERTELETLVERIERRTELWRPSIDYSDSARHFVSLHRDEHVDVWLLCWTTANDTGWHDHDISSGAVRVVEGALTESAPRIGGQPAVRVVSAGQTFSFGPEHIHRITGTVNRSISIHAYSPALVRLGQYSIDADGVMRRQPVSYLEELRAFDAPLAA
jgi:predicted metal-dependent enzyme (double-stranded beta helix superfamily)